MRVSISSSRSMLSADSMLATESVTLMPIPCSGVAATKMPPPGPLVARIRWVLESRRSASRRVGRLTPKRCARSSSRPRRSPGCSAWANMEARIASATSSLALRRSAGSPAATRVTAPAPKRGDLGAQVQHAPRLAAVGRQDPRFDRHDPDAQPERLAQPRLDLARVARVVELDLDLDLVHRVRVVVERDRELPDAGRARAGSPRSPTGTRSSRGSRPCRRPGPRIPCGSHMPGWPAGHGALVRSIMSPVR